MKNNNNNHNDNNNFNRRCRLFSHAPRSRRRLPFPKRSTFQESTSRPRRILQGEPDQAAILARGAEVPLRRSALGVCPCGDSSRSRNHLQERRPESSPVPAAPEGSRRLDVWLTDTTSPPIKSFPIESP